MFIFNFLLSFALQPRRMVLDRDSVAAMDDRAEAVEGADQLRTVELCEEARECAAAVQPIEQVRIAIQDADVEHHGHSVYGNVSRLPGTISMARRLGRDRNSWTR